LIPSGLIEPAGTAEHVVSPAAEIVPARHGEGSYPLGHLKPAGHPVHDDDPGAEKLPVGQAVTVAEPSQ